MGAYVCTPGCTHTVERVTLGVCSTVVIEEGGIVQHPPSWLAGYRLYCVTWHNHGMTELIEMDCWHNTSLCVL